MSASEAITGNGVADREREKAERDGDHYGVQHVMLPAMLMNQQSFSEARPCNDQKSDASTIFPPAKAYLPTRA